MTVKPLFKIMIPGFSQSNKIKINTDDFKEQQLATLSMSQIYCSAIVKKHFQN